MVHDQMPNHILHLENLTEIMYFISIDNSELPAYEEKHQLYLDYTSWATRSDGHGGSKGGTMGEYLRRRK